MATIYQAPPQQQMQQQIPQQVQQQNQSSDLFNALAKYITSGPGPSSTTAEAVQSIIDYHTNQPNGIEYLSSIVNPVPDPELIIWKNEGNASGFISTNLDSLTIQFMAPRKYKDGQTGIPLVVNFEGKAPGFFGPGVITFKK